MTKVTVRGGFSDRNNIKPENKEIQLHCFDRRTRIQLQNMTDFLFRNIYGKKAYSSNECIQNFCRFVLGDVFSEAVHTQKFYLDSEIFEKINFIISNRSYDDVLTLIEALINYWDVYLKENYGYDYFLTYSNEYTNESVFGYVNSVFKREYIGYRFIDGLIMPISDKKEVETIEESLDNKYATVRDHISKANILIADRSKPDYENLIKESISAVEALCIIITNSKGNDATLGKMLGKLEESGVAIHPAMKQAFNCLYGYTSDASGIRHAGTIEGPESTFEEAKYMLVSCCAFVNYVTALFAD